MPPCKGQDLRGRGYQGTRVTRPDLTTTMSSRPRMTATQSVIPPMRSRRKEDSSFLCRCSAVWTHGMPVGEKE